MNNFFIHIGYPKAASTALQKHYFSRHPDLFYLGPYDGGYSSTYHNALVKCAVEVDLRVMKDFGYDEGRVRSVFYSCYQEFLRSGRKRIGFSFEGLTFTLHHDIDVTQKARRLRDLFGADVKIIMVIRSQFALLRSMYRQLIAVGLSSSFQQYISDIFYNKGRSIIYDLNYEKMFTLYSGLFGEENVLVVPMEYFSSPHSQLLEDISKHLGISPVTGDLDKANEALNDAFYVAFRELNARYRYMMGSTISEPSFQNRYAEYYSDVLRVPVPQHMAFETNLAELLWAQARELSRGQETRIDDSMPKDIEEWLYSYYSPSNRLLEAHTKLSLQQLGYP